MLKKKKKRSVTKSKSLKRKVKKMEIKKPAKHDGTLFARVQKKNLKLLKDAAKKQEVNFSTYMDQLIEFLASKKMI